MKNQIIMENEIIEVQNTNYDNGKEFFFQNYNECLEQINN